MFSMLSIVFPAIFPSYVFFLILSRELSESRLHFLKKNKRMSTLSEQVPCVACFQIVLIFQESR